ncbi:MAG TPA: class I SAM-dependent methyltransferase [Vicinamibacterales bacterium]
MIRFDVDLFTELNEEYKERPLVPRARNTADAAQMQSQGNRRAAALQKRYDVRGLRTLEIGCGRGEVTYAMARELGCDATGIDIVEYPEWADRRSERVTLRTLDITSEDYSSLGTFDFIYSFAVWEHIRHPYAALKAAFNLLRPGGRMYLNANLYRGPKASHRYREVFFPWPHLLFTDEVFAEFYRRTYGKPRYPAWVNRLVAAEYAQYFTEIGFRIDDLWFDTTPIDEPFYARFESVLGRYPRTDLQRDFIHADLRRDR